MALAKKAAGSRARAAVGKAGGLARAAALAPEKRRDIAREAATARWDAEKSLPKVTHVGEINLGGMAVPCAVLDTGQRVVTSTAFYRLIAEGNTYNRNGDFDGPNFLAAASLRPFISAEMTESLKPIPYRLAVVKGTRGGGIVAKGILATAIPDLCDVWLRAREAGSLHHTQVALAARAEMLVRALAKTGIVALVDEATGYEKVRDRDALQALLDAYLRTELAAWAKRFPDEFYEQIFRLRGWQWKGMGEGRPQCVGKYTKDLVYARLAPGVLEELERRARDFTERKRKPKYFQWLTDDIGVPALSQHLHATIGFMRVADTWRQFRDMMDRAFPKRGDTLLLPLLAAKSGVPNDEDE